MKFLVHMVQAYTFLPHESDSRLYEAEYKLRSIQILQYLLHRSRLEAVSEQI